MLGQALREKKFSRCEFSFFKGVRSIGRRTEFIPFRETDRSSGLSFGDVTEYPFYLTIGSKCGIAGNVPDGQFRENGFSGELF